MEENFPFQLGDFEVRGSTASLRGINMYKTYFYGSWEIISLKVWLEKKTSCKPAAGGLRKNGTFKLSFQSHYLLDHLHNTWSSHCQIRGLSAIQDVLESSHP